VPLPQHNKLPTIRTRVLKNVFRKEKIVAKGSKIGKILNGRFNIVSLRLTYTERDSKISL
jgi:hypothetical protein